MKSILGIFAAIFIAFTFPLWIVAGTILWLIVAGAEKIADIIFGKETKPESLRHPLSSNFNLPNWG